MKKVQMAKAKDNLSQLVEKADAGEAVHITRRGKPGAVLVSEELYRQKIEDPAKAAAAASSRFVKETIAFRKKHAAEIKELFGDGEDVFANVRDPSPGRLCKSLKEFD